MLIALYKICLFKESGFIKKKKRMKKKWDL